MEESKIYSHKTCRWYQVCARLWLCFLQVCRGNFYQQYWNSGFVRSCFDRFLFIPKKKKQTNKSKQNKKQNNQTKQRFTQQKQRRQQKRPDTLMRNYIPDLTCRFLRPFPFNLKLISKRVKHRPPPPPQLPPPPPPPKPQLYKCFGCLRVFILLWFVLT